MNGRVTQHTKISQCNALRYQNEGRSTHIIILIGTENAFGGQTPFLDKTHNEIGIERYFLNLIHNVYKKPIANIILHGDKHEAFPQR